MATLLDLFCGAGGAAHGYRLAGFTVVGVDDMPQPNYAGDDFFLCDAFTFLKEYASGYDAVHASPPCQSYGRVAAIAHPKPKLIEPLRKCLKELGKPYIIENVPGAPLHEPVLLCGTMFHLKVFRHRLFETNFTLKAPVHTKHTERIGYNGFVCVVGHGSTSYDTPKDHRTLRSWQEAMQISWMTKTEMTQALPPAYTEYIGQYLREHLHGR